MQKVIKIMNFLIIAAILVSIYHYNKNNVSRSGSSAKTNSLAGSVQLPYIVLSSTKRHDYLFDALFGQKKNVVIFSDLYYDDFKRQLERPFYGQKLDVYYNYMPVMSPKGEAMKCEDGTQNCFVHFFLKHCPPSVATVCVVNPVAKSIIPLKTNEPEALLQILDKYKNW